MLANVYMSRFLKHWRRTGRNQAFDAHVIAYADDFVILSRGHADEALAWTKAVMTKLGLTLNEAKTVLRDARTESFAFLGYSFGPHRYRKDGHWYLGASPSKKSVLRIKTKPNTLRATRKKVIARWQQRGRIFGGTRQRAKFHQPANRFSLFFRRFLTDCFRQDSPRFT